MFHKDIALLNRNCLQMKNEFVVDDNGTPLRDDFTLEEYKHAFSTTDIFQGTIGDCFLIGAIMSMVKNKKLLTHVIPMDNARRENMNIGAYHFRLWKMGLWYDVVIDDFLLCDHVNDLLYSKNATFENEFWISLLEKAVAK